MKTFKYEREKILGGLNEAQDCLPDERYAKTATNVEFSEEGFVRKIPGRTLLVSSVPAAGACRGVYEHTTDSAFFVLSGVNDTLVFVRDAVSYTASIVNGNYATGALLATAVQTAMNLADTTGTYQVAYSTTTFLFTITKTVGVDAFSIDWTATANVEIGATMGFKAADTGEQAYTSEFSVSYSSIYVFISLTDTTYTQCYRYVHGSTPSWYSMKSDLTYSTNNWSCVSMENGMFCCNGVDNGKIRNNRWLDWGVDNPAGAIIATRTDVSAATTTLYSFDPTGTPPPVPVRNDAFQPEDTLWLRAAKFNTGAGNTQINQIQLYLKGYATFTTTFHLIFYNSAGAQPGSFAFGDANRSADLTTTYGWKTIDLRSTHTVTESTDYWVQVIPITSAIIWGCSDDGTAGNYGKSREGSSPTAPRYLFDWTAINYDPGLKVIYEEPATGISSGTWQYAVTFKTPDSYETMSSEMVSVTMTAGSGPGSYAALTGIPTAPSGDDVYKRYLYRTLKGGSILYLMAEFNDNTTTTYDDYPDDDDLVPLTQCDDRRREPPPTLSYLTISEGRIVGTGYSQAPNFIYLCETYQPQWFDWSDVANSLLFEKVGNNEANTGIYSYRDREVSVFKSNMIYRMLDYGSYNFRVEEIPTALIGCVAPFSIAKITTEQGATFLCFLGVDGELYIYNGSSAVCVSRRAGYKVLTGLEVTRYPQAYASVVSHKYRLHVTSEGGTTHDKVYVFDTRINAFSIEDTAGECEGIVLSHPSYDNIPKLVSGDASGNIYLEWTGLTRNGAAFAGTFRFNPLDQGEHNLYKHYRHLWLSGKAANASQTLTLTPYIEGTAQTAQTITFTTSQTDQRTLVPYTGRDIALQLSASDSYGQWELYGIELEAEKAGRR